MNTDNLENSYNVSTCSEIPLALTITHLGFAESWGTPAILQLHMTICCRMRIVDIFKERGAQRRKLHS
jgi:hypothetical protein